MVSTKISKHTHSNTSQILDHLPLSLGALVSEAGHVSLSREFHVKKRKHCVEYFIFLVRERVNISTL